MILGHDMIVQAVIDGDITHSDVPLVNEEIQPQTKAFQRWITDNVRSASIDLEIGEYLAATPGHVNTSHSAVRFHPKEVFINPFEDEASQHFQIVTMRNDNRCILPPGYFCLVATKARIGLSEKLGAEVKTRSSVERWGLDVCKSAGWIDPGYQGYITLEVTNHNHHPIVLRPGMRLAQLVFFEVSGGHAYHGSYHTGERVFEPSMMLPKKL